jgi:hypothetical protein
MAGSLRGALAGVVALLLCAAACSGGGSGADSSRHAPPSAAAAVTAPEGPALLVKIASDIQGARLTRQVLLDGGLLRLSPPSGSPGMTEQHAIQLFRAGGGHAVAVRLRPPERSVIVAYAIASLRLAIRRDPTLVIQPRAFPVFDNRPAWVIIGSQSGPCNLAVQRSSQPASESIELIAADTSGEALVYDTAGSVCGFPNKPKVEVASYSVLLPWTVASRSGTRLVLRHAAPPACSDLEGGSTLTSPTSETITIGAYVLMVRPPCTTPPRTPTTVEFLSPKQQLMHGATGLAIDRGLDSRTFTYFDGTTHT